MPATVNSFLPQSKLLSFDAIERIKKSLVMVETYMVVQSHIKFVECYQDELHISWKGYKGDIDTVGESKGHPASEAAPPDPPPSGFGSLPAVAPPSGFGTPPR